jgi:CheY-like chemotaxis protein
VVLLDEKLHGSGGPFMASALLDEIGLAWPDTRVIVVTAYATRQSVRSAFDRGAEDYLLKDELYTVMYPVKLARAVEAVRAARRMGGPSASRDRRMEASWQLALDPSASSAARGDALEQVVADLMASIPGFGSQRPKARSASEEIDLIVRQESTDPVWSKRKSWVLVECRNRQEPVDRGDMDAFVAKLRRRAATSDMMLIVSLDGFTKGARDVASEHRASALIVLIDRAALNRWMSSRDRGEALKRLLDEAAR